MSFPPAVLFLLFVLFNGSWTLWASGPRELKAVARALPERVISRRASSDDGEDNTLPFEIDDLCLSYTLGLGAPRDISRFTENPLSDIVALSAECFNESRLLSHEVATARYIKKVGINLLQARETCLAAKAGRFFIVAVAGLLDEKFDNFKTLVLPILDHLVPGFPAKAPVIKRNLSRKLGIRMIKAFMEPLIRKLFPENTMQDLAEVFENEFILSNESTLSDTFAANIRDALSRKNFDLEGVICPTLQDVATTFQDVLPEISDIMKKEVLEIIADFRTSLEDKGITISNVPAVEALFDAINIITRDEMQYAIAEMGTGNPADIRGSLAGYWDITLPVDLSGEHPEVASKMQKVMDQIVGEAGALRDLYNDLQTSD